MDVITYLCWDKSYTMLVKGSTGISHSVWPMESGMCYALYSHKTPHTSPSLANMGHIKLFWTQQDT